jgi:hypothetical protein
MILPRYRVAPSRITDAGQGLFLDERVARGSVVVAPDAIPRTYTFAEIGALPDRESALAATVRWFEDRFTVTPEWPDECYVNHSFSPTGLWHLGFIFAARDLEPGVELTVDYRHLLAEGQPEEFVDAETGREIIGWSWAESLARSTAELQQLIAAPARVAARR